MILFKHLHDRCVSNLSSGAECLVRFLQDLGSSYKKQNNKIKVKPAFIRIPFLNVWMSGGKSDDQAYGYLTFEGLSFIG